MYKKILLMVLVVICLSGCRSAGVSEVKEEHTEVIQEQGNSEVLSPDKTSENEQADESDLTDEQDMQRLDYIYGWAEKNMDRDVVRDAIRANVVTSDEDQIVKAIYVMEMKTSIMLLYWEQPSKNGYTIYHAYGSGLDKEVKADEELSAIEEDLTKYVKYFDGKEFYEVKPGYFADNKNIQEADYFYIDVTDRMNGKN